MLAGLREREYRTIRQFAEEEIIIPSTSAAFRCSTQPYSARWFDAIDSGQFQTHLAIGPSQSGKTFHAFVCPILYHLFEVQETVLVGCPSSNIVSDKWNIDIRPAIEKSRYRDFLPTTGEGARGGDVKSLVQFRHGPSLRFMTAGGGDKARAHFTTRVLVVTEVDDFDEVGKESRESTKLKQLFARQRRFPRAMRRTYLECTVTDKRAYTWRTWEAGSSSVLATPCFHCGRYVTLEREHLVGWQEAENEDQAAELGYFACSECGANWSETDRRFANENAVTVHRDQRVLRSGQVVGPSPRTSTFALRWNAANNLFLPDDDLAVELWSIEQEEDPEESDKEATQFSWAMPWEPEEGDTPELKVDELRGRKTDDDTLRRGFVPADAEYLTLGIDLGKRYGHYVLIAWTDGQGLVADYGMFDIHGDQLDVDVAILKALREFREEVIDPGWPIVGAVDEVRIPDLVGVDSGYQFDKKDKQKTIDYEHSVYQFALESNKALGRGEARYFATKGAGETQYVVPTKQDQKRAPYVGWFCHVSRFTRRRRRVDLFLFNSDRWKSWVHRCLRTQPGERGAIMFYYSSDRNEHIRFARHLTAEVEVEEFVPGKGVVRRWDPRRKQNHWLDAAVIAATMAHKVGFRIVERPLRISRRLPGRSSRPRQKFVMEGGRKW